METNSETKLYHFCSTRYSDGTRFPIKKGNLCYHPTSALLWKKVDSYKPEKKVIDGLVVISDIINEYDVEFLDEQGHIKLKLKGISRS